MGDAYSSPVIWHSEQTTSTTTTNNFYYLHRDYLGSILGITDKEGIFKEKRHFDAWGNIVKLTDGTGNNLTAFKILDRGYTGHEHLLGVGIIHMNGRLYDPILHRFLSPDNFVQDPFNTQNFNRYGYVLNNPLMYVDPSGEEFFVVLAAIISVGILIANAIWGDHDATPYQNTNNPGTYVPSPNNGNSSNVASSSPGGKVLASEFNMPHFIKVPSWLPDVNLSRIASSLTPNESWLSPLQTGLDIVGLAPVVGEAADGINALIYLAQGDYVNAGLSGAAMVPFLGMGATGVKLAGKANNAFDLAGVAKGGVNAVEQFAVHGNSLKSLKPTWGYKLYSQDGTFLKNGITNKLAPQSRYTRAFMSDKYMNPVKQFNNRLNAWNWEFQQNKILRGILNKNMH